ncbi:UNVERIFIED_CONTAM: hypothetical protein FKN15_067551 [Acipenser sinensis]
MPVPHTEPPVIDPVYEAYAYCNIPNNTERGMEGHSPPDYKLLSVQVMIRHGDRYPLYAIPKTKKPAIDCTLVPSSPPDYKLLSVQVMIRHGDRYPLYAIPKTKKPAIDCTLVPSRKPSHPQLAAFLSHMSKGSKGRLDSVLSGLPRFPSHSVCEMGELTQTAALGLSEARFPRFAARVVFELWRAPKDKKSLFVRVLYNGKDVTFQTSFCQKHSRRSSQPLCPFQNFMNFVKKDMFAIFNSTNYYDACHRRAF